MVVNMKTALVIGLGKFGMSVAEELCSEGIEVLGVDTNDEIVKRAAGILTHAIVADAEEEDVLKSIGVQDFDCVILAIANHIQESILITILLKELGAKNIIVKAQSALHSRVLKKLGADTVVMPEHDMGKRLAQKLVSNSIMDYIELSEEYSIAEIGAKKDWYDKTLKQLGMRDKYGANVIAVKNNERITIAPGAAYVIKPDDALVIVAANDDIDKLR